MHLAALIQLALWTTLAQAFFPFVPTYVCDATPGCGEEDKRALQTDELKTSLVKDSESKSGEPLTFKLSQRISPGNQAPPAIAARQVERLRRKFGFVGVSTTLTTSKDSKKRDNTFTVATAATPSATNSVGIDQDGSDISYFVEAKIGSGGQSLYLLCDTGAGSTWIMGADCDSAACEDHTTWSSSGSTTYTAPNKDFSIAYGTGSVSGMLAKDSISIGSVKVDLNFGLANVTSSDFTRFAFDGILGLSMASGSSDNYIESLKSDKVLTSNVFGVDIFRASDGPNTGELTMGGTNSKKYTGDITYTAVNSAAHGDWAIPLDDVAYNGSKAGVTDRLAYIDTGTTYAFAPKDDVAALHKLIPGASSTDDVTYTAPCDSDQPIVVSFSGVDHEISVKDWLSSPSSSGSCTSNIFGQEVIAGAWLLGDVFLKNVYAVFDADESQIGFATKASTTTSSTTTSASSSATSASSTSGSASSSTTAATESNGAATASATSSGGRLESTWYSSIVCVVAIVGMVAL